MKTTIIEQARRELAEARTELDDAIAETEAQGTPGAPYNERCARVSISLATARRLRGIVGAVQGVELLARWIKGGG